MEKARASESATNKDWGFQQLKNNSFLFSCFIKSKHNYSGSNFPFKHFMPRLSIPCCQNGSLQMSGKRWNMVIVF